MAARWCVAASALVKPGEAQAGVNGSVEFSPALRGCETFGYVGDGRLETGGLKGSGDVEFGASALQIPRERTSGGKPSVNIPNLRAGAARLLKPGDRLIKARLQQMRLADPEIVLGDARVTRAEADGLLLKRDRFVDLPDRSLAPAQAPNRRNQVAVQRERRFIFGDRFGVPSLHLKHCAHGEVHIAVARRSRQGAARQSLRAFDVGLGRRRHKTLYPAYKFARQPVLRFGRVWFERQRALEPGDRLVYAGSRQRSRPCRPTAPDAVEGIGTIQFSRRLRNGQFDVQSIRNPGRDLVLQREQIAQVTIEPLGPKVRVGLSVDQLG